jgi:hypothetical protein
MVQVKKTDNGYKVGQKTLWAPLAHDSAYVSLMPHLGNDMEYDAVANLISYPGEYDIDGVQYRARVSKDSELNYSIITSSTVAVICQTKKYLNTDELPDAVDTRIFTDAKLRDTREKMELEGETVVLGEEETAQ